MKSFGANSPRRPKTAAAIAAASLVLVLAGCGRREQEAAESSTSYTQRAAADAQAQLFTIPPDQMSHIQVVEVQPGKLKRLLRLSGTVTYNAFETTPVITQVGGPVSRVVAVPGQQVRRGQPLLYVSSPD